MRLYLKCMLDQIIPARVACVLGFIMSFLPTVRKLSIIVFFLGDLSFASSSPSSSSSGSPGTSSSTFNGRNLCIKT